MNKQLIRISGVLCLSILLLSSCATKEKMVYFQDNSNDSTTISGHTTYTPVLKKDDFISVIITADDHEAAIPFNFPVQESRNLSSNGYTQGNPVKSGYLIDEEGFVSLPVLGKVHVAGMSRMEATSMLETMYQEYLTNPVVNIHIDNYKITVLGDVVKPGTFKIPNERITILEAIGLAGDLNITGERTNILVIRDQDGKKMTYRLDLTSSDILSSPAYYLQQNDVVYVEPNSAARSQGTFWRTSGSILISVTSLIVTTISIIL